MKNILLITLLLSVAACSDSNGGGAGGGAGGTGATGGSGGTGGTGGTGGSGDRTTPPDDLKANPAPETTDVGAPIDEAEVQTVGTAGGTLRFFAEGWRKGPTLVFPAGAVAEDTEISVAPIVSHAPHAIGETWRFGPEDVVFSKPVEVRFPLPAFSRSPGSTAGVGVAFQNAGGFWEAVADVRVDEEAKEVVASVDHFSDWTAFQMLELRPSKTSVQVGESLGLWVYKCTSITAQSGDIPIVLLPECNAASLQNPAWKVNGVAGGNGAEGEVLPVIYGAIYTAPAEVPAGNPVAVSVEVALPGGGKGLLVSNVEVKEDDEPCSPENPCEWIGSTSSQVYGLLDSGEVGLMHEAHATIRWRVQQVTWDAPQIIYEPQGTAVYVDNVNGCHTPEPLVLETSADKLTELRVDFTDPKAPTAWFDAYVADYPDGEICGDERYDAGFAVGVGCTLDYDPYFDSLSCSGESYDEDSGVREVWRAFFFRENLLED